MSQSVRMSVVLALLLGLLVGLEVADRGLAGGIAKVAFNLVFGAVAAGGILWWVTKGKP